MKKIALAFVFCLFAAPAFAACLSGATPAGTATLKDAAGSPNTFTAPYVDDGSGNCVPKVQLNSGEAGTPATGVTQPAGGVGLSGWLSGIYKALTGTLTVGLPSGASTSANQSTEITSLASIAANTGAAIPAGTNNIGTVGSIGSQYPTGATAITASATGTTAATTATLAGTTGKTTYICSSSVRANATAAATVTDTITGLITATISSLLWVAPAASGVGVDEQIFSPCVPASATNTGIAVVSGAPGTGGNVTVHATGYQL